MYGDVCLVSAGSASCNLKSVMYGTGLCTDMSRWWQTSRRIFKTHGLSLVIWCFVVDIVLAKERKALAMSAKHHCHGSQPISHDIIVTMC